MTRCNRVVQALLLVMLPLFPVALTACSQTPVVLQGQQAVQLRQNESAPWPGWLIQDETLARILEAAESCRGKQ